MSNKVIQEGTIDEVVEDINEVEKLFNEASDEDQWEFVLEDYDGRLLLLSEDKTEVLLTDDEDNSLQLVMKFSIGMGAEIICLLNAVGVPYEIKQEKNDKP